MIRSLYDNQDSILTAIQSLHCPEGFDADLTYGNGMFWKNLRMPALCFDATPLANHVRKADSGAIPLANASLRNAVFDPPFLTYVKGGRKHSGGKVAMTARFGGYYCYEELAAHYRATLRECYRLLIPDGKLVFKCQDIIHNHRIHCTHANVIRWGEECGFRLLDLFVLAAKSRMPGPQKGQQKHARIWHSYFLVLKRDRLPYSGPI